MLGVFVGSAALIVILSAFNGLENLVISLSNTLNPDLVIEPAQGKTFDPNNKTLENLSKGFYFLKLTSNNESVVKKLIVN